MKSIGSIALLLIALAGGMLPAGRNLTMLIGGCEMTCCQKCAEGCCAEHTAAPILLSCPNCDCGTTQYAIQTVSPVQVKQDLHSDQNAAIVPCSASADCDSMALLRSIQLNRLQRPPDIPLFLEIHALLV